MIIGRSRLYCSCGACSVDLWSFRIVELEVGTFDPGQTGGRLMQGPFVARAGPIMRFQIFDYRAAEIDSSGQRRLSTRQELFREESVTT
jgi:hypothetical protein